MVLTKAPWRVSGTYYEVCNCEAICPCRRVGQMKGGKPTYDECDFVLSWRIIEGHTADTDLSNLFVVLSGTYSAIDPKELWRVMVYVDERGTDAQREMLQEIFLGRAGGTPFKNFANTISDVISVHSTRIRLVIKRTRNTSGLEILFQSAQTTPFPARPGFRVEYPATISPDRRS